MTLWKKRFLDVFTGINWMSKASSINIQAPEKLQEPSSKPCALPFWWLKFGASLVEARIRPAGSPGVFPDFLRAAGRGREAAGCARGIQFQVPKGGHLDYRPGQNNPGVGEFTSLFRPAFDPHEWSRFEIL